MADVSLASLALRLAVSMGVVIGLMMLAAKLLRRAQAFAYSNGTGGGRDATGGKGAKGAKGAKGKAGAGRRRGRVTTIPIAVTTIAPLTRTASVAIVRASGRELVLGVTETHVSLLHSSIEPRDQDLDVPHLGDPHLDDLELDDELHGLLRDQRAVEPITTSPTPAAARIAAADSGTPHGGSGLPAWTDALETLRAMTVRR